MIECGKLAADEGFNCGTIFHIFYCFVIIQSLKSVMYPLYPLAVPGTITASLLSLDVTLGAHTPFSCLLSRVSPCPCYLCFLAINTFRNVVFCPMYLPVHVIYAFFAECGGAALV